MDRTIKLTTNSDVNTAPGLCKQWAFLGRHLLHVHTTSKNNVCNLQVEMCHGTHVLLDLTLIMTAKVTCQEVRRKIQGRCEIDQRKGTYYLSKTWWDSALGKHQVNPEKPRGGIFSKH